MERSKYWITIILWGFIALNLKGSNKSDIYNSYIKSQMLVWKSTIDKINSSPGKSNEVIIELLNYQYGYIGWCLGNDRKDEAVIYLKLAEENVKLLEGKKFELSLINGYKSALYGFRIALNKFSAPFIGPKSSDCAKLAVQLDPNQPFGYIQLGNVKLHSPSLMGGSKSEALVYYLKARTMMEKNGAQIRGDWNYLSLLVTIARAYVATNNLAKAKLMYEEILKFEPGFIWVKDDLYPQLLKKMAL